MKKIIDIPGELDKANSIANKLSVKAAQVGKDLKNYIQDLLIDHVEKK